MELTGRQVADVGPSERISAAMALEPGTDEVYLFGGHLTRGLG